MKTQDEKRAEAEVRQAEHDGLTAIEKLGKLAGRPGESKRERLRQLAGISA